MVAWKTMFRVGRVAVLCAVMAAALGASEAVLKIPVTFDNGLSGYVMLHSNTSSLRQDLFQIRITQTLRRGRDIVALQIASSSGKPLPIDAVYLGVFVPAANIDGVWTPSGRVTDNRLISADPGREFTTYSAANYGIPYLGAANSEGKSLAAVGLLEQDLGVQLRAAPAQGGLYEFQLKADVPPNRTSVSHQFFVSNDSSYTWYDIAERYADWVDANTNYSPFPISNRSYKPVYDTWYWSEDRVDDNLYFDTAESASAAGLGTFLADSGWDAPAGEYNKWLLGSTGNYQPSPAQFPDLPATFDALRSTFNLQVQLWLQPFAVGRASNRYPQTQAMHIQIPRWADSDALAPFALPNGPNTLEDVNLCPQMTATHQYLKDLFSEMASTYHPEGYWLDFIDGIPPICVAPHRHDFDTFGAGFRGALQAIRDAILASDPNPVVQFRAQYANLNNKSFANVWQPFDSPNNYDRMRLDALRLRPFSKGVVFAADELYWPETVNDITVARFVMTDVMTGVPSIGANLKDSRPSSVDIVKNWMDFYKRYEKDLTRGRFRPLGSFRVPNHTIESDSRIFVYIRSTGDVKLSVSPRKQIFLMNGSDIQRVNSSISVSAQNRYTVQAFNRHVHPQGASTEVQTDPQGLLEIDAVVQRGGMLQLTPITK